MEKDARLEEVSDKIRNGQPVGIIEAIEAISYQKAMQEERKRNTLMARFVRWINNQ